MTDRRSEARRDAAIGKPRDLRGSGEVILLTLATLLGLLWAIVLVTHFHGHLSQVGQSLWLTR
ncbi:hypothetical protein [Methylobacterium sp. J-068]|uniref:hypothetical protein n=1 Tax=Methylobacterium sp. J-068 TaxID=2836649 RepID=UPI001FB8B269|nr:hypothetical protein [Methylobacterium sp. J-068]MCJ2035314.1 hypothetical protein [Methylobacterium sp. J-068]